MQRGGEVESVRRIREVGREGESMYRRARRDGRAE